MNIILTRWFTVVLILVGVTFYTSEAQSSANSEEDADWSGQCGERDVYEIPVGTETTRWGFPWTVGLFSTESVAGLKKAVFLCGGALIDERAVLTAAGCVHQRDGSNLFVHIGRWDVDVDKEPSMQVLQVERLEVHSNVSVPSNDGNSIALLFLKDAARISRSSNRVCLPDGQNFHGSSFCYVVGWRNADAASGGANQLLKLEARPDSRKRCQSAIRQRTRDKGFQLPKTHLCADYTAPEEVCGWANGSAMVCSPQETGEQYFLVGIGSHSVGSCADGGAVDVFLSTQQHIAWIDRMVTKHHRYPSSYRPEPTDETAESESET